MQIEILEILRCPNTGQKLVLKNADYLDKSIMTGLLTSEDGKNQYPIRNFIPRLVAETMRASKASDGESCTRSGPR